MSDVKGQAIDPALHATGEPPMDTRRGGTHEYPLEAGLNNFWRAGDTHSARVKYYHVGFQQHRITDNPQTHEARRTLNAEVRRLSEWDGTFGEFWLWDDDGWAYWAQPLGGTQATGMFLNSFSLTHRPAAQVYYAIIADMQAATIDMWEEEFTMYSDRPLSDAGRNFMFLATGGIPPVGSTFSDRAGIQWRVLHEDAEGRKLVITEHVHGFGTFWHSTNPNPRVLLRNTDSAQPWLEGFWDTMGADMRNVALEVANPHADTRTASAAFNWTTANCPSRENTAAGRTVPSNNPANASNGLFVLSISELNQYFGLPPLGVTAHPPRIATNVNGTPQSWWLRSPGSAGMYGGTVPLLVSHARQDGVLTIGVPTNPARGFRPALWIQP